ncbi:MAG: acetylpolyamine amidohydrolase [Acidimicrobiia bacterium]|nr:MAG: acetylpolyamine amidohydrolase [Acidimicrobiia bacterium]
MRCFDSDAHRAHHPRDPIPDAGRLVPPPEVPERAERIRAALDDAGFEVTGPTRRDAPGLRRVHTGAYLRFLEGAHAAWRAATGMPATAEAVPYVRPLRGQPAPAPRHVIARLGWYSHDSDPVLAGTWSAARAAVDLAASAWDAVAAGRCAAAYALCRPPGHHAAADSYAGYCYLNNAAVVAQAWCDQGARVAVLDVDYHHGNGTQQIFYDRDDVLFVSLHADPAHEYPYFLGFAGERGRGAGEGCTRNLPLAPGSDWSAYGPALAAALGEVRAYAPDGLVVSLGVDTALEDGDSFRLVADDFLRIGEAVGGLGRPTVYVQEGGYDLDVLGRNVTNVLLADGR